MCKQRQEYFMLVTDTGDHRSIHADFRIAKTEQAEAALKDVHYTIKRVVSLVDRPTVNGHVYDPCSFPQCYTPCKHCPNLEVLV